MYYKYLWCLYGVVFMFNICVLTCLSQCLYVFRLLSPCLKCVYVCSLFYNALMLFALMCVSLLNCCLNVYIVFTWLFTLIMCFMLFSQCVNCWKFVVWMLILFLICFLKDLNVFMCSSPCVSWCLYCCLNVYRVFTLLSICLACVYLVFSCLIMLSLCIYCVWVCFSMYIYIVKHVFSCL